ncbi:MAG: hypothetical protein LBD31_07765 [Treponema sp.]|nr:hypothetical protein [Treponema sp.]
MTKAETLIILHKNILSEEGIIMGTFEVTGRLSTVVAVKYRDQHVEYGKWTKAPIATCPIGTATEIFKAENRDGAAEPPEAWVKYSAADGTLFKFYFDDPETKANYCYSTIEKESGPWAVPEPDYPKDGKTWKVTFKITHANSAAFLDAPIFPEDLLAAPKCDLYTESQIRGFIGDRTCLYLRDVLEVKNLKPFAKVWCVRHPIFLTAASKALLLRDLVQLAVKEMSSGNLLASVLDKALEVNNNPQAPIQEESDISKLKGQMYDKYAEAEKAGGRRDCELIDSVVSLLNPSYEDGWANAVSSYIGSSSGDELDRRLTNIIRLVEKRL